MENFYNENKKLIENEFGITLHQKVLDDFLMNYCNGQNNTILYNPTYDRNLTQEDIDRLKSLWVLYMSNLDERIDELNDEIDTWESKIYSEEFDVDDYREGSSYDDFKWDVETDIYLKRQILVPLKEFRKEMKDEEDIIQNLQGLNDLTILDDLIELRIIMEDRCSDLINGGSFEDNGFNLKITYNGKPWLLKCRID